MKWPDIHTEEGLSNEEALHFLELFGPNKLEQEEQNVFLQVRLGQFQFLPAADLISCGQFLSFMWNPLLWAMEGAALIAIALSNGEEESQ